MGILLNIAISVGSYYGFVHVFFPNMELKDAGAGAILVGVFGLVISTVFLNIFGDAVTALLMCYGVDLELNNYQAKFGPPSFHEKLSGLHEY